MMRADGTHAAANDFIRPNWLLANMTKLGVRESWLTRLGLLKAAGALGVLVGIRVPLIGVAAAVGLNCSLWVPSSPICAPATTTLSVRQSDSFSWPSRQ